jgi:Rod binding domain-containing protein
MNAPVSSSSPLSTTDPPVVSQTLEPAWVRDGSATTQKAYQTALAFEQMLVEQLSQSLTASSGLGGESGAESESSEGGSSGGSATSGPISSMLPQALTSGVMNAGGLGLAAQMTRQLQGAVAATPTGTGTGTGENTSAATAGGTGTPTPASDNTSVEPAAGNTSASDNTIASGGTSA